MMENNTFRIFMVVGMVMIIGTVVGLFFTYPMTALDADSAYAFNTIFDAEKEDDNYLTGYETIRFYLETKIRGGVKHY